MPELKCEIIGNKKVLYISKIYEDLFEVGKYYPVRIKDMTLLLKCIRTAKRKVLYIPRVYEDLFQLDNFYTVSPNPLQKLIQIEKHRSSSSS